MCHNGNIKQVDYNNRGGENQELWFLQDVRKSGRAANWRGHKINNLLLSDSFERIGERSKSYRCSECGNWLEFRRFGDGTLKLKSANFCKVRLCPMCSWRRSLKIFSQVSRIMDYVTSEKDLRYIFVTLTVRNVQGDELSKEITKMFKAYELLTKRREMKKVSKGWFRCLEVTHNWARGDDYHPHIHIIIAVNKSYYASKDYISQDKLKQIWRECAKLDYNPVVNIKNVKPKAVEGDKLDYGKAVAEVAKYTVKATDFIIKPPDNVKFDYENQQKLEEWAKKETDKAVAVLDKALANRRLIAYGGIMREAHKNLNLDDSEDGDLVKVGDDESIRADLAHVIEVYKWHVGYKNYIFEIQ